MKGRKMLLVLGTTVVLGAAAVGCGGKSGEETESQTVAETTQTEPETSLEETTVQESETQEQTVTGEIVAAGMSSITIRTEDGTEESYLKEDTKVELEGDQVEGTKVTITYTEKDGMKYALLITDGE